MKIYLVIFLLVSVLFQSWSQDYLVDTSNFYQLSFGERALIKEYTPKIKAEKDDSVKLLLINEMYMQFNDNDVWIEYTELLKPVLDHYLETKGRTEFYVKQLHGYYNDYAYYYGYKNDFATQVEYNKKAYELAKEIGDNSKIAYNLNAIAAHYHLIGKFDLAVKYFNEALLIFEAEKDTASQITLMGNLAFMYYEQEQYEDALPLYEKAIKLAVATNRPSHLAHILNNLSLVYYMQEDYEKTKELIDSTLKIRKELGDMPGYYQTLNNYAAMLKKQKEYEVAIDTIHSIIRGRIALELWDDLSYSYYSLAMIFNQMKEYDSALVYGNKSMYLAKKINYPSLLKDAGTALYTAYEGLNNGDSAFKYYKLHIKMKDSLYNEKNVQAAIKNKLSNDFEKKAAADSVAYAKEQEIQEAELEKKNAEIRAQNTMQYGLIGGLILVIIFAVFMFNRFKLTQKQKGIIERQKEVVEEQKKVVEHQKDIVEEKHKEITDSINYAERIQCSFLATDEMLSNNLGEYFVLFKPKDVVSGDFYWAGKLNNGNFAYCCADSTGHGVPGAIMSILNVSSLEKAIESESEPHLILNKTREIIIDRLKKDGSSEGGKDGMDCSLLSLDPTRSRLIFAAANNPVIIIRGDEIVEFRGDKMPVGKHNKDQETFSLHEFELKKGDMIYTLTDGFPDQFGGLSNKKYMIKNLRNLFRKIAYLPTSEQKALLDNEFEIWRGDIEQIDDMCIMGVRV